MEVPILNGIYTDANSNYRVSYPVNLEPVVQPNGVSQGYLRPAAGITQKGFGTGADRGGVNWNGRHYRVMGTSFVEVTPLGAVIVLGNVGGTNNVDFDNSFDLLAIVSNFNLFYWDGSTLAQLVPIGPLFTAIGLVKSMIWIDGYFMYTDGEFIISTELNNPLLVLPTKYASSEVDPDPIVALLRLRGEMYALNRYTVEVFTNIGGIGFPFQRVQGAQLTRGCIGASANAIFMESVAFIGGGRNESPAVWVGVGGRVLKISTREIDILLSAYTENQLSVSVMEVRKDRGHDFLYIHLPDRCLVYDGQGSQDAQTPVWFTLTSSVTGFSAYRARHFVYVYDAFWCADPTNISPTPPIGVLDYSTNTQYGKEIGWNFSTLILYNESRGAIFHSIELICLTGRTALGASPTMWTSYSYNGVTFSQERPVKIGAHGNRNIRVVWFQQGVMGNQRIQYFRGTSDSVLSISRLEIEAEELYV